VETFSEGNGLQRRTTCITPYFILDVKKQLDLAYSFVIILLLLMGRKLFLLLVTCYLLLVTASPAQADTSCQPIYGGGQSCVTTNNIIINKTVLNPQTNQFVDNLSINDPKYQPGFITTFQISVTNTGNNNVGRIDVRDIFPQYVNFGSGAGTFDTNTNTLSFSLTNLAPNETRKYSIVGRIFNADQIPVAQGSVICVVNQAIAMVDNANASQDNAQLCIEKVAPVVATVITNTKGGFPVLNPSTTIYKAPATGPEMFGLIAMIPTGLAGWFLRKHSMKKEAN